MAKVYLLCTGTLLLSRKYDDTTDDIVQLRPRDVSASCNPQHARTIVESTRRGGV